MPDDLTTDDLCRLYGIRTDFGHDAPVPEATKLKILSAIGADPDSRPAAGPSEGVVPPEGAVCHCPDWLLAAPAWGIFCQLYELTSERNWGIGDFGDLARLAAVVGAEGADFLGVNPVHALFLAAPDHASPFTPSNRRFLNPLYIAMDDLPGPASFDQSGLAALRAGGTVDYTGVRDAKITALRAVHAETPFGGDYTRADFETFVEEGNASLRGHALFEALSLRLEGNGHGAGWTTWPTEYQDAGSGEVADFAAANASEVDFHLWLQWLAARQLASAQDAAKTAGMRIGIYLDLAVGEAPDGSASWSAPGDILGGLAIGAPPDVFAQSGQNWMLAAPSPTAMLADRLSRYRALIAAQLRYSGALRIDHAMSLWQLFLVPEGESALAGTHLRYPFAEMMRVVSEESQKHGAIIIGEDLGWVPPGFREAMHSARMLSYRIFYFETEFGLFRRPSTYPQMALGCISTHDLPTLATWWRGEDIALRRDFGLTDDAKAQADFARRSEERRALIGALVDAGQLAPGGAQERFEDMPPEVLTATCRFLASTPCLLAGIRLADLVGPEAATNVPGTVSEHPNWRRKAPVAVDAIAKVPAFREVTAAMREMRPRAD